MNMKLTLTAILFALASPSKNTINSCQNLETFVKGSFDEREIKVPFLLLAFPRKFF